MLHFCGSRMWRRLSACAIVMGLVASSHRAEAQDDVLDERRMQAQALADEAQKAAEKNPKAALRAFRAAYETEPDFRVLYNIGRLCQRLSDAPCAMRAYERYLADGADKVSAPRRKEVEAQLKVLAKKVPPAAAAATAAEPPTPAPAPAPTLVAPPPPPPAPVAPAPAPLPAPAPAAVAPAPQPVRSGPSPLTWLIPGVLGAGAITSGVFAYDANDAYEHLRGQYPITRDELDGAHSRAKNWLTATAVLGAATAISLGVVTYLAFSRKDAHTERAVDVAVGPMGVSIHGKLP